jgi:hypothetical protein
MVTGLQNVARKIAAIVVMNRLPDVSLGVAAKYDPSAICHQIENIAEVIMIF